MFIILIIAYSLVRWFERFLTEEKDKIEEKLDLTTAQLNSLKAEHYTLMSDNKEKSEKLTAEM